MRLTTAFRVVVFLACAGLSACDGTVPVTGATVGTPASAGALRLGHEVVPLSSDLSLTIVPHGERLTGHVDIDLDIRSSVTDIYLHGKDLAVTEAGLYLASGKRLKVSWNPVGTDGLVRVGIGQPVSPQRARLEISWSASLDTGLQGLYRVDEQGHSYAFTQFEPVYARQVFPSFDQPDFKIPFAVSLNVPLADTAVANMPIVETLTMENGLKRVRFETTPPIPTYLLAFAVGPFDVVTGADIPSTGVRHHGVPFRGIAVRGKGGDLAHAMRTTPQLLEQLEDYFGIAYPYPKLDIIAVPDFAAGAMENVGAITFRESLLLLKPDAPVLQRRRHASVMAHELAHQWFGNLVTMPWWDDIWLNEAFATWISFKMVEQWNPAHRAQLSRLARVNAAMDEDSLLSARQIRQPVVQHHDIFNAFDSITYSKGGAVLTMFEHWLGEDRFRDGVRHHLKRFAGGNADINDFVDSLSKSAAMDIAPAFRSFLFQPGMPRLRLTLQCNAAGSTLQVSQSRYSLIGTDAFSADGWQIPLCVKFEDNGQSREQCGLVTPQNNELRLDSRACPQWVLPNAGFAGYYQWVLPVDNYQPLVARGAQFTELEELSIADSVVRGFASGDLDVAEALLILSPMAASPRPEVSVTPMRLVAFISDYLVTSESQQNRIVKFAATLYEHSDSQVVFDRNAMAALPDDSARLYRLDVARFQARYAANAPLRTTALRRVRGFVGVDGLPPDASALPAGSWPLAFEIAVQEDARTVVGPLRDALLASRDAVLRDAVIKGLAHSTEPSIAEEVRNMALEPGLRTAEIRTLLTEHVTETANRQPTWQWLQQHFDHLVTRMPPSHAGKLPELVAGLCDRRLADEVQQFLQPRMATLQGGPRNLAKAVERVRQCAARVALQRQQLNAWNYLPTTSSNLGQ